MKIIVYLFIYIEIHQKPDIYITITNKSPTSRSTTTFYCTDQGRIKQPAKDN